jgi:RimJ/RimL family protein N-acetyltransferase
MHYIEGIKTKLIEVDETDAAEMINLRNNPAYNKYLFQQPILIENQVQWINDNRLKKDNVNFKVVDLDNNFKGTISIYDIKEKRGEFGRYIVTNPINAIEAEYLFLKFTFDNLKLESIFCQTNQENNSVWNQHTKLGFRFVQLKDVLVGDTPKIKVKAVVQEISAADFHNFNYSDILQLLEKIKIGK